jgi:hypothetical protein
MKRKASRVGVPILIDCNPEEQEGTAVFGSQQIASLPYPCVRAFRRDDFEAAFKTMEPDEREHLGALVLLRSAMQQNDAFDIERARGKLSRALTLRLQRHQELGWINFETKTQLKVAQAVRPLYDLKPGSEREALEMHRGYRLEPLSQVDEKWLLAKEFSRALCSVNVELWWSGSRLLPALYCCDLTTAAYAFALVSTAGWGLCLHCAEFFVQRDPKQIYCSPAHGIAHRVARSRANRLAARTCRTGAKNQNE